VVFILLLVIFFGLVIWLLPKIWKAIALVIRKIRGWFGGDDTAGQKPAGPADTGPDERRIAENGKPNYSPEFDKQQTKGRSWLLVEKTDV
jgi:hypothetical protein